MKKNPWEQDGIINQMFDQWEKDYERHFKAIEIDFENLNWKLDISLDGLNDVKSHVNGLENEIIHIKASRRVDYIDKPQITSHLSNLGH